MRAYLKAILYSLVFIASLGSLIYVLDQKEFFSLTELDLRWQAPNHIESSRAFQKQQQFLEIQLEKLKGQSLLSLSVKELYEDLKKEKWLSEINISRRYPSRLELRLTSKDWLAMLLKEGKFYPFTENADLLAAVDISDAPSVPIIYLEYFPKKKEEQIALRDLLLALPEEGQLSKENVVEVRYQKENFIIKLRAQDQSIEMGRSNFALRAARANKVLDYLEKENLQGRVIMTDFSKKVVVKLRKSR